MRRVTSWRVVRESVWRKNRAGVLANAALTNCA